jgi:hypothetical protein
MPRIDSRPYDDGIVKQFVWATILWAWSASWPG